MFLLNLLVQPGAGAIEVQSADGVQLWQRQLDAFIWS